MIHNVYSVFDSKSKVHSFVHLEVNKAVAVRGFEKAVNDPSTNLYQWPEDFVLFELGTFDDEKGLLTPHECPLSLGVAVEFKSMPVGGSGAISPKANERAE